MGVGPSVSSNASDRCKKEVVTATQRSVLLSKIAFFAFLAVVAAVAGGMFAYLFLDISLNAFLMITHHDVMVISCFV
jgi:hypothetical protein